MASPTLRMRLGRLKRRMLGLPLPYEEQEKARVVLMEDDLPRNIDKPGGHGGGIAKHFGELAFIDPEAEPIGIPLVILAFFNRSGSNLLATQLRDSGAFFGLREQLNHGNVIDAAKKHGFLNFEVYLRHITKQAQAANAPFGVKASAEQIGMLHHYGVFKLFSRVDIVHIERDDVLGQAISYCIAEDTSRWSSAQKVEEEREPEYDHERIRVIMREIALASLRVRLTCEALTLPRIPVLYEDLVADINGTVLNLSKELDVHLEADQLPPPALKKQANDINADFRARFLRDLI